MNYFLLAETEFFRRINEAGDCNMEKAYTAFATQVIELCNGGRKQKIQRSILQSVVFQWYKIQYFFTGTNYLRLKLFVIRTFILFLKIKMYACRTFWLSCFFIKDVDNAAYTVGKTFQRGKRPVLLWQSRLKKMSSASGYERNGV